MAMEIQLNATTPQEVVAAIAQEALRQAAGWEQSATGTRLKKQARDEVMRARALRDFADFLGRIKVVGG